MQSVMGLRIEQCAEGRARPRASREAPAQGGGRALPGVAAGRCNCEREAA
jgi:hypothetical protein